ncbi:MAG: galactokinase [Lachnospiraceae bacterium]|nr:galactokinase [Lachnospiraceae bacterium]
MNKEELLQAFGAVFGEGGDIVTVFSPGRVNMIGEHTDYNGGHVFPCALTIGTYFAARKRDDRVFRFFSGNFEKQGIVERTLDALEYDEEKGFTNYLMGMVWSYAKRDMIVNEGMDVYLWGNIPNGSGLSSSASIEVGMGKVLNEMYGFDVPNREIALIGQYSENNYNGVNCGIMDQFAVAMGKADNAIFLDTATLEYEYAPLALDGMKIVIASSNKKRRLGESKYNERRAECEEALAELQTVVDIKSLGELTNDAFEQYKDAIKSEIRQKRARHAVYENQRTVEAVRLLKEGEVEAFGKLMNDSHVSLRDDYEVTGIELDTLAEEAWKIDGCVGSRMTGAGFGGCTVSIVKDEAVDRFIKEVGEAYLKKIGYAADFYVVSIGEGTHVI